MGWFRRRRRRRGGLFGRISRGLRRVFRRRRRRKPVSVPRKKVVRNKKQQPAPFVKPIGKGSNLTPQQQELVMKENLVFNATVPGNDGNILIDTEKDNRLGKWLPG